MSDIQPKEKFTKSIYEQTLKDASVFHKYILGEPFKLTPAQQMIMRAMSIYPETMIVAGSKGGKSTLSSEITLWNIYRLLTMRPAAHTKYNLVPDSKIYAMVIAPKEDTALNVTFQYIVGQAEASWYLSRYIENIKTDELWFTNKIIVRAQGSSSRAGRGYQIFGLILDEVCHFMDTSGNMSGQQVLAAYLPRLLPFGMDGRLTAISTPAGRQGAGWEMFSKGVPMPRAGEPRDQPPYTETTHYILQPERTHGQHLFRAIFQIPTWEMNPLFPYNHPFLQKERIRDPWNFQREYGAQFADVVSTFFNIKQLEACVERMPLPPTDKRNEYVIAQDPGIILDNWALAMGHLLPDERVRIDFVQQWNPTLEKTIDVLEIERLTADLCNRYNVVDLVMDQSRAISTIQRFQSTGLPARGMAFRATSDVKMYQNLLELVNTKNISLPPDTALLQQLRFLERITLADRFRVQGAPGTHDDLADVIAMIAYVLKVEKKVGSVLF